MMPDTLLPIMRDICLFCLSVTALLKATIVLTFFPSNEAVTLFSSRLYESTSLFGRMMPIVRYC